MDIYVNTDRPISRSIVAAANAPQREAPIGEFVAGSTYSVNLYFITSDGSFNAASGAVGQDVQVAISTISEPESGDFTLTDGTNTTATIAYGATAQAVEDALNALNTDTGPNGSLVDVVKQSNTQYTVTFRTLGAQTAISGSTVSLFPESTPTGSIAVTGDASTYAQQVIELTRQPAIYQQAWSTITDGFNGELALNTTRLLQSLVLEAGEPFYIEVKLNGETVAREVVGMEHSTMPASAFSGAAITNLLDAFAADPTSNANFNAAAWAAEIAAGGTVVSVNGEVGVVVLDMDDFAETATNKILTAAERTKLGDQVLTDVIDKMAYNADDLTFDIDTGTGVVVQIGQELLVKARNVTGSTITNGSVVRINGASGDRPTITPAQADSLANISGIIGIVTADILNNAVGFVTVHGLVRGLDTSTYTEGDELFLSSSVAGGFTSTEPTLSIPIGTVTFANPASGEIFANVDNQKHLLEFASDPTLLGNFSAASWKTALAIAAADVDFGTGTDSYVWTSDGAGGAAWEALAGGGDMLAATYDPTAVAGDAFAMDNMVEGATTKILTATERSEIAANTAARHDAVTVSDSAEIDLTLAGQDITASLIASSIDETKLDASVNASLDLADSASQPGHTHVISDITDNVAASTGVLTGGVLSTGAGATEYSISDGTGIIVDETGAITDVSWSGKSNITPTNIATSLLTWVSINSAGNVVEMTSPCSPSSRRSEICLGVIVHVDKATVDNVNNEQVVAFNPHSSVYDLADALGFINVSGNVFSANGANLNLNKAVGEIFATGSNYDTSATNPHIKTLAVLSALTFQYRFSDGSNGVTGIAIDPDNLDDGIGGTTAVGNNRWSVQRIYSFVSNNVKIQRGVEDFVSKADAIAGIASEAYVTEPSLAANGLLRGWLVVKKGAADLSDTAEAQFIEAGKLGEVGSAGAGGGAGSVATDTIWDVAGDLVVADGADSAVRLPIGTEGQVLKVSGGAVAWGTDTGGVTPDTAETSIWIDAGALLPDANAEASSKTGTNGNVDVMLMANTEKVYAKWTPPPQWDGGNINVDLYWTATGATAGHKVKWNVAAQAGGNDDAWDVAFPTPTATADDEVIASGDIHIIPASAITVGGTPADGDCVFLEIERTASGATQMSQEAELLGVRVNYESSLIQNWYVTKMGTEADDASGTGEKTAWIAPAAGKIHAVHSGCSTATAGGALTVDVKKGGTTILSTLGIIDSTESSTSTGTAHVLTTTPTTFVAGDRISFDINTFGGTGAKGLHTDLLISWD